MRHENIKVDKIKKEGNAARKNSEASPFIDVMSRLYYEKTALSHTHYSIFPWELFCYPLSIMPKRGKEMIAPTATPAIVAK